MSFYRRIEVHTLDTDFEKATRIVSFPLSDLFSNCGPDQAVIKVSHVGINASDINFSAGRYDPSMKPPFYAGFEAMGTVVHSSSLAVGTIVILATASGSFSEYLLVNVAAVIPIPTLDPKYFALLVSGQTAAIALNEQGRVQPKETVLITAAAGAAGIIAVQWAKLKGAHVIGTCSSPDKCKVLSELGCDRVINYNAEDVDKVLKSEYPKGIDVVFESVGGKMFQICVNHLAVRGRLIVIGSISTYQGSDFVKSVEQVSSFTLLMKSTTISGFFLPSYIDCIPGVVRELMLLLKNNAVTFPVDLIGSGLESVQAGIAYLYDRKNIGKVVVPLSPTVNL